MVTWRIDEFTLTTFHLRPSFHRDILNCMTPWFRHVGDIRLAIYRNATDPKRRDQYEWMKRFEKMIVAHGGKPFLPPDEEKPHARTHRRAPQEPDDPGSTVVEFE